MARTKSIASRKHRKILKKAKGYRQARSRRIKTAKEAVLHAGQYAYIGRKNKKRDLRKLWIIRLNAAARKEGISYSKLIKLLKENNVEIDRKILSNIAVKFPEVFKKIVASLK
ncbi:MAG: 50S ribosomal protein L20 [Patescibacteria group bacterium]|nr:MAG: 50S ribosomal protein L20 [Patescibacteria group bacterium]